MFENIGRKIKGLAVVLCIVGIIASFYIGLKSYSLIQAGLTIVLGSLLSWVGSFALYGFGDLIDTAHEIKQEIINIRTSVRFLSSKISTPGKVPGSEETK